jgi:tetratricopeptide (TPR) repeat protein
MCKSEGLAMNSIDISTRIKEIEGRLSDVPENEVLQEQLAQALVERLIDGEYEEGKEEEGHNADEERLKMILDGLDEDRMFYNRAYLAYIEYEDDEATQWIEKWATQTSDLSPPFNSEDCFQKLTKPFGEAPKAFWQAIAASLEHNWPDAAVIPFLRGYAEGGENPEKAQNHYKDALNKDRGFWRAALNCAYTYYTNKNWERANHYLDQCLENQEARDTAIIYTLKASCLHQLERYSEEEQTYRHELALDNDRPGVRTPLGVCLFLQGKFEEALAIFEEAILKGKDGREPIWYKIKTLEKLNRPTEATSEKAKIATAYSVQPLTYLFTWNPNKTPWPELAEDIADGERMGFFIGDWSCGRTKKIRPGDRFYLHCQGKDPKGIVGTGTVISDVWEEAHWNVENADAGQKANYVDVASPNGFCGHP